MAESIVFIFVAAGGCGGCKRFKENFWPNTKKELSNIVEVIEVDVPRLGDPLPPNTPKNLSRYVHWYPTFILATKSSWNRGELQGIVFNGETGPDGETGLVPQGMRKPIDGSSVLAWVRKEMVSNPLFQRGSSMGPLYTTPSPKHNKIGNNNKLINSSHEDSEDDEVYIMGGSYCQQAFTPLT